MGLFTDHPASVGESYGQHFRFATGIGARMVAGGMACIVHGLLPFLLQTTGSRTIRALHADIQSPRPNGVQTGGVQTGALPEPEYLI